MRHSTSPPCGNLVDGLPHDCQYRTAVNWRHPGPAKIHDNGRHFYVFSDLLYYELLVCYIQIIYIVLKFNFVWVSALVFDQTFVFNSRSCSLKCWQNDEIFEVLWKSAIKTPGFGNLYLRSSPWRKFQELFINEVICSTSSRRKPSWRFTAGSTVLLEEWYGISG